MQNACRELNSTSHIVAFDREDELRNLNGYLTGIWVLVYIEINLMINNTRVHLMANKQTRKKGATSMLNQDPCCKHDMDDTHKCIVHVY